jgi:cobalt-zinc-cadmium efflux system protein
LSDHVHAPPAGSRRFAFAIALNVGFAACEVAAGIFAASSALVADALHNFADVLGLIVAWAGSWFARHPPSARFTYGLRSTTIFAALANGGGLLLACGGLAWEAIGRLFAPAHVAGDLILIVAAVGIAVNALSAALFWRDHTHDLNARGAFLHLAGDAAVSLGVCIAGFAILHTGWLWLDPAVTLAVVVVILATTWGLVRDAALLGLHGVPATIDLRDVEAFLRGYPEVEAVHDLHVWALSTTETALTTHLVMPNGHPGDTWLESLAAAIAARFGIQHATVQVELAPSAHRCALEGPPASASHPPGATPRESS